MKKKVLSVMLALTMIVSVTACGLKSPDTSSTDRKSTRLNSSH